MSTKLLDALINYRLATTESPGYALLETETDVDSDFHAATASAVFKVQNDANDRVLRAGDTMTGNLMFSGGNRSIGTEDENQMSIQTNGIDRIRVLSTGQVGIGENYTPSLDYELDVNGSVYVTGNILLAPEGGDILVSSDGRFKTDVKTISNALEKVTTMRGVTYRSTRDPVQKLRMGLIAQELERVAPEVVNTDGDTGYKSVAYGNLVGVLVEAVKELNGQLSEAKTDVKELNDTVKELNGQLSDERTVTKELNDTVKELEEKVAVLERRNEPPA